MSTQAQVRVGFIGAGWTERVQIPMFRKGGLIAQAICSGQPANAQRVAQQLAIPEVYDDWRALITARPPRVFMRTRKPWVRARRVLEGW